MGGVISLVFNSWVLSNISGSPALQAGRSSLGICLLVSRLPALSCLRQVNRQTGASSPGICLIISGSRLGGQESVQRIPGSRVGRGNLVFLSSRPLSKRGEPGDVLSLFRNPSSSRRRRFQLLIRFFEKVARRRLIFVQPVTTSTDQTGGEKNIGHVK